MWDGHTIAGPTASAIREHVSVIFQDFARFQLSARDNIAVGRIERVHVKPTGIQAAKLVLQLGSRALVPAPHATHEVEPAVEVDHPFVAGSLVQAIDVLGENEFGPAGSLEPGQRHMREVRLGTAKPAPADHAARPVPALRRLVAHEGLIGDRLLPLPVSIGIAVIGDTGIGAATGPGQHEQAAVAIDKVRE